MPRGIRTPPFLGSKSGAGRAQALIGVWVNSHIPWEKATSYIEPFAGMLGVLLQRQPVNVELVNDANVNIVNWWQCIRDHPSEMEHLLSHTPNSREEHRRCAEILEGECEPLERARAFTVILQQGLGATMQNYWVPRYTANIERSSNRHFPIRPLADRLRDVQLENKDALDILERTAVRPDAVVYCDPPYPSSASSEGYAHTVDYDGLRERLLAQKGRVAISGQGDEWDELGWEKRTRTVQSPLRSDGVLKERLEAIWMNYVPSQGRLI